MERLTEREQEILNILKQEPMIAQEELAARLKITRSAAAVHISNLIKKGFVLGRGYVFNEKTGVVLIGCSYLIINGAGLARGQINQLNYGKIGLASGGGVGSTARHLSLLNVPTILLSALGRDNAGDQMAHNLNKAGVNTNHILRSKRMETGKIFTVARETGEVEFALVDPGINQLLGHEFFSHKEHILDNCQHLVFDTSLPKEVAEQIFRVAAENGIPVTILPVFFKDLDVVKDSLGKINLLILNREQLALLTGAVPRDQDHAVHLGGNLVKQGLQVLVITFGEQGVALITPKDNIYIPNSPTQVVDTDAASDAIAAGLLYGLIKGFPYRQAIRLGLRAATLALSRASGGEGSEEYDLAGIYYDV